MRVQRGAVDDVLFRDGEAAVLVGESLIRLSEISAFIYAFCLQPTDVVTLSAALEGEFGAPPGRSVQDVTKEAVLEMMAHGLLVEST